MNALKIFIQNKIDEYIKILQIEMTRENVNEITYADKLTAIGGLSMAVDTMREIDPSFTFDIMDYFPEAKKNYETYSTLKKWNCEF